MAMMLRQRSSVSSTSSLPLFDSSSLPLSPSPRGSYCRQSLSSYSSRSVISLSRMCLGFIAVLTFLPWALYTRTTSQWKTLNEDMTKLVDSHKKTAMQLNTSRQLLSALEANKKHLESSKFALIRDLRWTKTLVDTHSETYDELEKHEDALLTRIDDLEYRIQENSKFAITEEFGPGPHQVEIRVTSKAHTLHDDPIVLELAALNVMPHSVHYFLRMVTAGLWPDMTFMPQQSARHRIHASPVDMNSLERVDWKFEKAKLSHMVFSEHSPNSCGPYSVGFTGTGPGFYVNGGYLPALYANESCFAKVISGERVVQSIVDGHHFVIGIESIRFLPQEDMISP